MRCGLIGEKLGHSYSKLLHDQLQLYDYRLIPLSPAELPAFLKEGDWQGLNVTIPYKQAVLPYCDHLSQRVLAIGSANTLVRQADGSLLADNTDYDGLSYLAEELGLDFAGSKTLVLGSGGTSRTAVQLIKDRGGLAVVISRQGEDHYGNLHRHLDADFIINTTPVGMYPDTEAKPLDLTPFTSCRGLLDAIYNPFKTRLVLQALDLGIPAAGGLTMLTAQAVAAARLFTGLNLPRGLIGNLACDLLEDRTNLVLIGMPGSGKTSVGRELAAELDMDFADSDEEVEALTGRSIPDFFEEEGEAAFRALESQVLQDLGKEHGLVIATGGGVVKDEANRARLRQNGRVILLDRSLKFLSLEGRPLSKNLEEIKKLHRERWASYQAFADLVIPADVSIPQVVAAIRKAVGK